jgi:hypothetical protein
VAGHVLKKLEEGEITVRHVHEGLPELAERLSATIDRSGQATDLHLLLTRLGFAAALGLSC